MTEYSNSAAVSSLATEVAWKVSSKSDVQRKSQYKTLIEFAHGAHSVGTQKDTQSLFFISVFLG